jgi:hypothetical protein
MRFSTPSHTHNNKKLTALLLKDLCTGAQDGNGDEALLLSTGDAIQPRLVFGGDAVGPIAQPRSFIFFMGR